MPYILEYFIPGFIYIKIFQLLTSRKTFEQQILISITVSYILKAVCTFLHNFIFISTTFVWEDRILILSLLSLFLSILSVVLSEQKRTNSIIMKINHKSIHDDIWQDIIDYKNGTTLRFVCENAIYTGILVEHEEKGSDSWFVLDDYIVEENKIKYSSADMEYPSRIAINLKNVKRVELYYGN